MNRSTRDTNEHDAVSVFQTDTGSHGHDEGDDPGGSSGLRFAVWALLVGAVPLIAIWAASRLGLTLIGGSPLVTHCPWF